MAIVRLVIAGFLLFPIAQFVALFWWYNHTLDGVVPAFAVAAVESVGEWLVMAVNNPLQTLLYAGFLAILGRIAFRH